MLDTPETHGTITTLDEAKTLLDAAAKVVASSSRLTRSERTEILGKVYSIRLNTKDREAMTEYIINSRKIEGANRAYVMRRSNGYILPLRYVFPSNDDRSNVSRYAGALSELAKLGVPPHGLEQGLKDHGGIVQLYWKSRDRVSKRMVRQTITLDRPIDVVAGKVLALTLMPDQRGVFSVLGYSLSDVEHLEAAE